MQKTQTTTVQETSQPNPTLRLVLMQMNETINGIFLNGPPLDDNREPEVQIEEMFKKLDNATNEGMQELKKIVKSKIPKHPDPKDFSSDEAFVLALQQWEAQMANYKSLLKIVKQLLDNLASMFEGNMKTLQDFYDKIWDMFKNGKRNEAKKKMEEFNRKMAWNYKENLNDIENMVKNYGI